MAGTGPYRRTRTRSGLTMRIAIITDAWHPQVDGVVRTLETTARYLGEAGHEVAVITPQDFRTFPCPTYPEIRLALWPRKGLEQRLNAFEPGAIHIATEGPLGHAAHSWCQARKKHFTTSFHTQFPEYVRLRAPIPIAWTYAYLRRFHGAAVCTMVPTESQRQRLVARNFDNLAVRPRGMDITIFNPEDPHDYDLPPPRSTWAASRSRKTSTRFFDSNCPGHRS